MIKKVKTKVVPLLLLAIVWSVEAEVTAGVCEQSCKVASESGYFLVEALPENRPVRLNKHHSWIVRVTDSKGVPLSNLSLAIGGGMPGHGHGLPTQPRVTENLGSGRYRISGLLFNMHGDWILRVGVRDGDIQDEARLHFAIDF